MSAASVILRQPTSKKSRGNTAKGLRVLARSFLESLPQDSHLAFLRLIIAEARRCPEIGQTWYARRPVATCQYVAEYLAQQQAAGTKLKPCPRSPRNSSTAW